MISPRPFTLFTGGSALAATLHRQTADLVEPQPTVLVMGSWLTVKEQMADLYAARLAARGYTAFTFDFSGYDQDQQVSLAVDAADAHFRAAFPRRVPA